MKKKKSLMEDKRSQRGAEAPGGPSLLEISSMIAGNVEIYFRNLEIQSETWKLGFRVV